MHAVLITCYWAVFFFSRFSRVVIWLHAKRLALSRDSIFRRSPIFLFLSFIKLLDFKLGNRAKRNSSLHCSLMLCRSASLRYQIFNYQFACSSENIDSGFLLLSAWSFFEINFFGAFERSSLSLLKTEKIYRFRQVGEIDLLLILLF